MWSDYAKNKKYTKIKKFLTTTLTLFSIVVFVLPIVCLIVKVAVIQGSL